MPRNRTRPIKFISAIGLGSALLFAPELQSPACTIFCKSHGKEVLVGNNEDASYSVPSMMWFVPAAPGVHGRVCFGWHSFAQGGMNDQGLAMDWAVTPAAGAKIADKPEFVGCIVERVLANCAMVDEAIALFGKFAYTGNNAHFLIADAAGNSVVGEWIDGKFKPLKKTGSYQLVTNFLLSNPKLGGYPCPRFAAASKILNGDENTSVEECAATLKAASSDWGKGGTKYSNVYDLTRREVYVYYQRHFEKPMKISLAKELAYGWHEVDLKVLFEKGPNAVAAPKRNIIDTPTANEILRRSIEARGAPDALRKIQSFTAKGTTEVAWDDRGPVEVVAARPNKVKIIAELKKLGPYEHGFDGKAGWEGEPGKTPRWLQAGMLQDVRQEAEFFAWLDDPTEWKPVGAPALTSFEGKESYELKLQSKSGRQTTHYFSRTNFLLVGIAQSSATPTGPAWSRVSLGEYRTFSGVLFPTRIHVRGEADGDYVNNFSSVEVNNIRAADVRPPKELQRPN